MTAPLLLVHGGASNAETVAEGLEAQWRDGLRAALVAGWSVLDRGGAALDAAQAAVVVLEDAPGFNAGRGSVLTSAGTVEMDAAVADGATHRFGAVAVVSRVAHPVLAARAVLDDGRHLLLAGEGAERFALGCGVEEVDPATYVAAVRELHGEHGTVGAVAVDAAGRVAAATSTGGVPGQHPGRIGDSPLIGAGTWADERYAVSATGQGEAFARALVASSVAWRAPEIGLAAAVETGLVLARAGGGTGGLIAVSADGEGVFAQTRTVLKRGWADRSGLDVAVWHDEACHPRRPR